MTRNQKIVITVRNSIPDVSDAMTEKLIAYGYSAKQIIKMIHAARQFAKLMED